MSAAACAGGQDASVTVAWQRVDPDPSGTKGPVDLVHVDGAWVGVGGDMAWTSTDGNAWTQQPVESGADLRAIVHTGTRFFAGGSVGQSLAIWRSDDAAAWTRVDLGRAGEPTAGHESSTIVDVAAGPDGILAAGTEWGSGGQRPTVLYASEGETWVRAEPAFDGNGARSVLATAEGFLLAGADVARTGEVTRAAFWWSEDGQSWSRVGDDPSNGNTEPRTTAALGDTLVVAGLRVLPAGVMAPAIWTSTDPAVWAALPSSGDLDWWSGSGRSPDLVAGAIQGTMIDGLAATDSGLVAVGVEWGIDPSRPPSSGGQGPMTWRGALWRSPDGTSWTRQADDPVFTLGESNAFNLALGPVLVGGGQTLILGTTAELGATVWRAEEP